MRILRLVIYFMAFLTLMTLGIIFGIENTQEVTLTFFKFIQKYTFTLTSPLWIVIGISFLAGSILTVIGFSLELIKMQLQIRKFKKQLKNIGTYDSPPSNETYSSDTTSSSQYDTTE